MTMERDRRSHRRKRRRPHPHADIHAENHEDGLLVHKLLTPADIDNMQPPEASPLTASRRRRPPAPMEKPPTVSEAPSLGDDNVEDPTLIDSAIGFNSSDISWPPRSAAGAPLVRAEEALIVLIVLVLWGAAIALFFNRWGKIRMLEPYQPKFQQQQHRASCPMLEIAGTQHRTLSKFNLNNCAGSDAVYTSLMGRSYNANRPRQNSVFAGSSCLVSAVLPPPPRRAKSAMDLQRLLQSEDESASPFLYRKRKASILPPVPPPLPPLPPPPILLPPASPALLRVTNV